MLFFASLVGDNDRMIKHWINDKKYDQALKILASQKSLDLYYKYSTILVTEYPLETIQLWMRQPNLDPKMLVPALLVPSKSTLAYLEHVIETTGNCDPVLVDLLLVYHVRNSTQEDQEKLISFVNQRISDGNLDIERALRTCLDKKLFETSVLLYAAMEMFEQAVDVCLELNDIENAQLYAEMSHDDSKKMIWMKIARFLIQEKQDIKAAIELVKTTSSLKLQDILKFFPDFCLINTFKNEIEMTLVEYNLVIEDLKNEMDEATRSSGFNLLI